MYLRLQVKVIVGIDRHTVRHGNRLDSGRMDGHKEDKNDFRAEESTDSRTKDGQKDGHGRTELLELLLSIRNAIAWWDGWTSTIITRGRRVT